MYSKQSTKYDEKRAYACRCPSCKRFMNVSGTALNNDKYIICWNCKAISKTKKWVEGSQLTGGHHE